MLRTFSSRARASNEVRVRQYIIWYTRTIHGINRFSKHLLPYTVVGAVGCVFSIFLTYISFLVVVDMILVRSPGFLYTLILATPPPVYFILSILVTIMFLIVQHEIFSQFSLIGYISLGFEFVTNITGLTYLLDIPADIVLLSLAGILSIWTELAFQYLPKSLIEEMRPKAEAYYLKEKEYDTDNNRGNKTD